MGLPIDMHSLLQNVARDVGTPFPPNLSPGDETLGVQFESLMSRKSVPPTIGSDEGSETISKLVIDQQDELNAVLNEVDSVTQVMPTMSPEEITSASVRLSVEFASMQFNMQTKMSVVNAAKSALETLMREG